MTAAPTGTFDLDALRDSTDVAGDTAELRRRADEDGYLFVRGLLPHDDVLRVRHDLLAVLDAHHWMAAGVPVDQGMIDDVAINAVPDDELRPDIGISADGYADVQRVRSMHALPHHPALLALYRRLFGEPVFVHPRHIVRVMTSHRSLHPTPPHQDFPLVQGATETWTCWFPLGDCSTDLGTLAVLRASHRLGYLPIEQRPGAGGIGALLCGGEDEWLSADFRAGDVLTFPAFTVHRAVPPVIRDKVRLSMDVRYQRASDPIEAKSLSNHADVPWDEVYRGWDDDDPLRHYWRDDAPHLSPWDDSLMQPGTRIC